MEEMTIRLKIVKTGFPYLNNKDIHLSTSLAHEFVFRTHQQISTARNRKPNIVLPRVTFPTMKRSFLPALLFPILLCTCAPSPQAETEPAETRPDIEARLTELNIELPVLGTPVANYVHAVRSGDLVFLAGKGPTRADGTRVTGHLGDDLTVEQGYEAARLVGIQQLAALKGELGDLGRVKRIVKVHGMVNATPDFTDHSKVINGFSDLMVEVFGERGKHARAAVGMASLPGGIAVEVEVVVEVE